MSIEIQCVDCDWGGEMAASDVQINCPECHSPIARATDSEEPDDKQSHRQG